VRKLELDAYAAFMKATFVTGMSWVSQVTPQPPPELPTARCFPLIRSIISLVADSMQKSVVVPSLTRAPIFFFSSHPRPHQQERDDLATKLRRELNINNEDHTKIKEKLSDDERIKNLR
jgi:hypothetical protein